MWKIAQKRTHRNGRNPDKVPVHKKRGSGDLRGVELVKSMEKNTGKSPGLYQEPPLTGWGTPRWEPVRNLQFVEIGRLASYPYSGVFLVRTLHQE